MCEVEDILVLLSRLRGIRLPHSVMLIVLVSLHVIYHLDLFDIYVIDFEIFDLAVRSMAPQINLWPAFIRGLL